jgi:dihydropteroate synthase
VPTERPTLTCGDRALKLGARTFVMGVVNVTPDSFSDGGDLPTLDAALAHARALLEAGADVLDVGGESTRPGAAAVSVAEEQDRVIPLVEALAAEGVRSISVDTRNAATARAARAAGAAWLNDVSALTWDEEMPAAARAFDAVVLMHARGTPETMQAGVIEYDAVVDDIAAYLAARLDESGLDPARVLVDPGIGFGKRLEHNVALTRGLERVRGRAAGVLYGPSRKRFLGEITGVDEAARRDPATHAAVALAAGWGADVVRVHDVGGAVQAVRVSDALRS